MLDVPLLPWDTEPVRTWRDAEGDDAYSTPPTPIDGEEMESMLCEIVLEVPKEQSRFSSRPGFSDLWDSLSADVVNNPDAIIEVPPEIV